MRRLALSRKSAGVYPLTINFRPLQSRGYGARVSRFAGVRDAYRSDFSAFDAVQQPSSCSRHCELREATLDVLGISD
jgi:hypothetical protein